ncbi:MULTISPECIES: hypothetical protein [Mesonia]|uniref:Uncharacterized protein n=1 Tax=Mesonia oceanica TaxID=2687242 RepID=A0AC61YC49_9FLAO|nr:MULTISPECIES: hypothetical protein [Mesonia]VVV00995.1 hypothetical protein FVB9532_02273 [Mesonia oceanica]|tara:strand:- start:5097 stop:5255 length:159 start_codon:yes stop_codon:yes gene_type:complete
MATDPKKNQEHEDYILKDNKKTKFGATFIIIVLILLAIVVVASGFYMEWWEF